MILATVFEKECVCLALADLLFYLLMITSLAHVGEQLKQTRDLRH